MQTPVSLFTSEQKKKQQSPEVEASRQIGKEASAPVPCDVEAMPVALKTLDELAVEASTCRLCALAEERNKVVFGVGNPGADIVFIGEAPGRDEDIKGEPFVGRAGQLLDRMLAAIELDRSNIYIMNTIKCRPPNNRDPRPDEVQSCNLWFAQQLEMLQPKMICLLGRVAAQTVLETDATLGSMRGRWFDYQGIPVRVTYHPAYLLRSPGQKYKSWQDLTTIFRRYQELVGPA